MVAMSVPEALSDDRRIKDLRRQLSSAYALCHHRLNLVIDKTVSRFTSWRALYNAAERGDPHARKLREIVYRCDAQLPGTRAIDRLYPSAALF
jgi:hypothetical protein